MKIFTLEPGDATRYTIGVDDNNVIYNDEQHTIQDISGLNGITQIVIRACYGSVHEVEMFYKACEEHERIYPKSKLRELLS